jgi:hypothetical protein
VRVDFERNPRVAEHYARGNPMTETVTPPRPQIAIRAVDTGRINPHDVNQQPAVTEISEEASEFARLMVYGLDQPEIIENAEVKAYWPLTMRQAARYLGMRLRRARDICEAPVFVEHYNKLCAEFRRSEKARNIATAVEIRDDEGDNSAATKTVRLKAVGVIEGTEGKGGVNVSVNVDNRQTNTKITAGYVIRLPADMPIEQAQLPQRAEPLTIEGEAE